MNYLTEENVVSIIAHKGYYYMHRLIQGQDYVGFGHYHGCSLSFYRLDPTKIKNWETYPFKTNKEYVDAYGLTIQYVEEPYGENDINKFQVLTQIELEELSSGTYV